MTRTLALCLGLLLSLLAPTQDPPSVAELARRIARDKDGTDPAVLEQLADHGDAAALAALERGLRSLSDPDLRGAAFAAIARFADRGELAAAASRVLENEVRRGKAATSRLAAARALCAFDPLELAEGWAARHKDDAVRALFADALVVHLAAREDPEAVRTILGAATLSLEAGVRYLGVEPARAARLAETPHREVVREALDAIRAPEARAALAGGLADRDLGRTWKLLLLRLLRDDGASEATAAIVAACGDNDPAVALLAVDFVVDRVDDADRADALEPLLSSRESALRRAAVAALGAVRKTDADFRERLLELAGHRDEALRMGAAAALAEVRTPEALAALVDMIPDESWSVRAEVLRQLLAARPRQAIPALIERLAVERGRMARDAHAALVGLSGMDLGRRPDPWRRWWEREGAGFTVPDAASARRVLERHAKTSGEGGSVVVEEFYEIEVVSERVVFVLDVSGSMRLPAATVGTVERTRMELAKEQLTEVLRSMPEATLFNVIFFESEVRALSRKLLEMNRSNRAKALRFVREQYALGATALYPALQLAFQDPLVDTIYLLSDGAPTEGEITDIEEVRAEVARWNAARHVRVHGIAMGQDSTLLRWLCEDTGGVYRRVE